MRLTLLLCLAAGLNAQWQPAWSARGQEFEDFSAPAPSRRPEGWETLAQKHTPPPRLVSLPALLGEDLLWLWQHSASGKDGSHCPYYPSCSRYSRIAVEHYGLVLGVAMTADRLSRCNGHANHLAHYEFRPIGGEWLIWNPPHLDAWWEAE